MAMIPDRLLQCFGCGVLLLDREGKLVFANGAARRLLGLEEADLPRDAGSLSWRTPGETGRHLPPEEHPFVRMLRGETINGEELILVRQDGSELALILDGNPLLDAQGETEGAVIDFADVTKLRRAKEIVEATEKRLEAFIGAMDEIVFEFDEEGTYLHVWTGNEKLLIRPREELIGQRVDQILGDELGGHLRQALRRIAETGEAESLEYPLDVMGGRRWFLARMAPVPHNPGERPTLSFLARDITGRKQMEEELRASERRFHQVLENIQFAAVILDPKGRIVYINNFLLNLTGWAREEAQGRDWFELLPVDAETARSHWIEAICGKTAGYHEEEVASRSGGRRLLGWNTVVLRDGSGKAIGCASIAQDITEQRKAEEILRRSDKMKREFISTAAHELRTPLTTILGYSELMLKAERFGGFGTSQRLEFLEEIYAKGEALSEIVTNLLDLSRLEAGEDIPLRLSSCSLEKLLEEEITRYRSLYPHLRFELTVEESSPPDLLIDGVRIREVLENLLSNAAKYSYPGRSVRVRGTRRDGGYLISIADEGIGMTPEQVEHVFDKFYRADTSDKALGGLGLGMCLARSIVEAHGGRIWVRSEPGHGTIVFFTLPPRTLPPASPAA